MAFLIISSNLALKIAILYLEKKFHRFFKNNFYSRFFVVAFFAYVFGISNQFRRHTNFHTLSLTQTHTHTHQSKIPYRYCFDKQDVWINYWRICYYLSSDAETKIIKLVDCRLSIKLAIEMSKIYFFANKLCIDSKMLQ